MNRQASFFEGWNDLQVLEALSKSNRLALAELYDRYWYGLYRVAFQKTKSREIAEELVQDLFLELWQRRQLLDVRQVDAYLFRALKYTIIDHIKSQVVEQKYQAYQQFFVTQVTTSTEDQVLYNNLVETIESELVKLPQKTQEVFRLSRFKGQTIPEISEQLSLSDKAVEYHLFKALKLLRLQLRDYMVVLLLFLATICR